MTSPSWPVRTAALGSVAAGTMMWRSYGQLSVTALVKATFALVPDAPVTLVRPTPIQITDRHERDNPVLGLRAVQETVPQLRQVDVVLYGHAHAPPGADGKRLARRSAVRLALSRDGKRLVDKRLLVIGNRLHEDEPGLFDRIPISLERALGGIGWVDNPLGKGRGGDELPNLVDPQAPEEKVGFLGPIPPTFAARRTLVGSGSLRALSALEVDIPPDLDWDFFQCAPPDQRIESLRGDEWIELDGLTHEPLSLRTRLPGGGVQAEARIYGGAEVGVPDSVPLTADLLQIDTDARVCMVTWRGSFPVPSVEAASQLVVVGALREPPEVISWPPSIAELPDSAFQQPAAVDSEDPTDVMATQVYDAQSTTVRSSSRPPPAEAQTAVMTSADLEAAGARPAAPFDLAQPTGAARRSVPGAPWSRDRAPAAKPQAVDLDVEETAAPADAEAVDSEASDQEAETMSLKLDEPEE